MITNDGKAAERSFLAYWEALGHVERIRDAKDLRGLNGGKRLIDFKKPSDFLVSAPGVPLHYAEVKSCNGTTSFPFGQIEEGQHKAALLEAARGSKAYIFYIFSYATGRWYCMPCTQYAAILKAGRRSVKFEELTPWNK